jgi:hypothetical protein
LREKANRIGAFHRLGRTMIITADQIDQILEYRRPCPSNRSAEAPRGGRAGASNLGAPITDYYRCSTGASEEAGAWDWCRAEEERQIRRHVLGEDAEAQPPAKFTFADAVLLYKPSEADAGYLVPILTKLGSMAVADITPNSCVNWARSSIQRHRQTRGCVMS